MKIGELLHLALPEEQWLPTVSGVLRQFVEKGRCVYERQPCRHLGKECQAWLHINTDGMQATFIDDAGEQKRAVDSIADRACRFMAHPQVKRRRMYGQVGSNFMAHAWGIAFNTGEWPSLMLTAPRKELIFEEGNVTVYAGSTNGCRRLCEWVKEAGTATQNAPLAVDTALNGEVYKQQVACAVVETHRGRYVKAIVSRAIPLPSWVDMPVTLLYGQQTNTPVRSFMFRQKGHEALGFSPELVMSVTDDKMVTEPLAGTRDHMGNPGHNKAKEAELSRDSKEMSEHILSVKEAITELEAVCQPSSVVVEDLMPVRQRGSVQHLGSSASGQLAENKDAWDTFAVLFPSITASDIPKNAALSAVMQIEKAPREFYSGTIPLLDGTHFDAALVLRPIFQDDQRCWTRAGAGIIARSTPERKLTETRERLTSIVPCLMMQE